VVKLGKSWKNLKRRVML
jgi:hypothetical protein